MAAYESPDGRDYAVLTPHCSGATWHCELCGSRDAPRLVLQTSDHGPICSVLCALHRRSRPHFTGGNAEQFAADHRAHVTRGHDRAGPR